jgi:hypothetical protein
MFFRKLNQRRANSPLVHDVNQLRIGTLKQLTDGLETLTSLIMLLLNVLLQPLCLRTVGLDFRCVHDRDDDNLQFAGMWKPR